MKGLLRRLAALPCCCGCARAAHQHYRKGSDCTLCRCPRYRRAWLAAIQRGEA